MVPSDLLRRIISHLDAVSIPYMVTGSTASIAYGELRLTQDIDIVIDPTNAALDSFLASLNAAEYYVSKEAAIEAMAHRSMFNVIDLSTFFKVDLIFSKSRPYDVEAFRRRVMRTVFGESAYMVTPEDSILSKLEWHAMSESERQFQDAVKVAASTWNALDFDYLRRWAPEVGVGQSLARVLSEADQLRQK
jgi:hypothetical protein